jgi:hypothetical protein
MSGWVPVRTCTWLHEAQFLKSVLEGAGIPATIPDEHTLGVQPLYAPLLGGVRLLVPRADLARASEVIESAEQIGNEHDEGTDPGQ